MDRLWEQIPDTANVLGEHGEAVVASDEVPLGSKVLVRPGERFPVDGVVATGRGDVDKSLLTGESLPEVTSPGDEVYAGTISVDAAFEVVTAAVGPSTAAGQIGKLLHDALWQRSSVNRLADRIAAFVVPAAVLIGLGTFAFWWWQSGYETGLLNGLAVLLIACPCALGIATPLTTWLAVGKAADNGVIARGFDAVERLESVRTVAFDKTGTLTKRPLRVESVVAFGVMERRVLELAAAAETRSEHPIAEAIAEEAGSPTLPVAEFIVYPGAGVGGVVDDVPVLVGNRALLDLSGVGLSPDVKVVADEMEQRGSAVVHVAADGRVVGLVELAERMRDDVVPTLESLATGGTEVAILTGDTAVARRPMESDPWRTGCLCSDPGRQDGGTCGAQSARGHGGGWDKRCSIACWGGGRHLGQRRRRCGPVRRQMLWCCQMICGQFRG